jgi:ribonucleotide reductase, class II
MVQELEQIRFRNRVQSESTASQDFSTVANPFPTTAPTAYPVFFRTYSRRMDNRRESLNDLIQRTTRGLAKLGRLTPDEVALLARMQTELKSLPSGRWMWVGGTNWIERPENFSGSYNCTSTNVVDWRAFGLMMDLAMMGCGTGAILEPQHVSQLPPIRNRLHVNLEGAVGATPPDQRQEFTQVTVGGNAVLINVGDSRQGWVQSYQALLELSTDDRFGGDVHVTVNLADVRAEGEILKGFGGVANPVKLPVLYGRCAEILNRAIGRQLTPVEACLLIDEAAATVVAGNIRRSAGMRQGSSADTAFASAKENLWQQDAAGNWRIDPERDSLRMANHTRVYHHPPTEQECIDAVRKQFYSGEGAIQYALEAIARANIDILPSSELRSDFLNALTQNQGEAWIISHYPAMPADEIAHRLGRYGLNPCGEIIGSDFHCNLAEVHLNQIDPLDYDGQADAFKAGALSVAALLNHQFSEPRYQKSRELDPIVGVSFTGLFDFFVHAFGSEWLRWWEAGRPDTVTGLQFKEQEKAYLQRWRQIVQDTVGEYCDRHGLKTPNRCTTIQPAGTKSLLTGASPGWHPPKAQRFIRRITFRKGDPVAMACLDYGYSVVPSQSDKDEAGNLLNDPFDPRCTEWLVEIPVAVSWADIPGADVVEIEKFSALAQFDFYMQVQKFYTSHNTSATLELTEAEIEPLGKRIHQAIANNEGYISAALLARFDAPFPRLPFEKIDKETYDRLQAEVLVRQRNPDFYGALGQYDRGFSLTEGPAGCDSDKCMMPEKKK